MNTKKHQATKFSGKSVALTVIMVSLIALFTSSSITSSPVSVNLPNYTENLSAPVIENPADLQNGDSLKYREQQLAELKTEMNKLFKQTQKASDKLEVTKKQLSKKQDQFTKEQKMLLKESYVNIADVKENLAKIKEKVFADTDNAENAEVMLKKATIIMKKSEKKLQMAFANLKSLKSGDYVALAEQKEVMKSQEKSMNAQEKELKKQKEEQYKMQKMQKVFHKSMVEDKLIGIDDEPSMLLSQKEFIAGGKKQSKKMHEKYLKLYHKMTGNSLENGKKYAMNYKISKK